MLNSISKFVLKQLFKIITQNIKELFAYLKFTLIQKKLNIGLKKKLYNSNYLQSY
jgi:hypothetical protein